MPLLLVLLALVMTPVQRPTDVVKWSATAPVSPVRAGEVAVVKVTAKVQPGWKLYAIEQPQNGPRPLAFEIARGSAFAISQKQIGAPKAKVQKQDENFSLDTRYYEHDVAFTVPVTVPRPAPAGPQQVPLEVTFQACGAELCLRPFTQKLAVEISVRQ